MNNDDQSLLNQNIISLLGLEKLPQEKKSALLLKMAQIVEKRMILRIWGSLDAKTKKELESVIDTGASTPAVSKFIQDNVPAFNQIMEEEIVKIKKELVEKKS